MDCTVEKEETSLRCAPAPSTTTIWIRCPKTEAGAALCAHVDRLGSKKGSELGALWDYDSVRTSRVWLDLPAGKWAHSDHPCPPTCSHQTFSPPDPEGFSGSSCTTSNDQYDPNKSSYLLKIVSHWYCEAGVGEAGDSGGKMRVFVFVDRPGCPSPPPGSISITVTVCSALGGGEPSMGAHLEEATAAAAEALAYALDGSPLCDSPCRVYLLDESGNKRRAGDITLGDATEHFVFPSEEGEDGEVKCVNYSWIIPFECLKVTTTKSDEAPPSTKPSGGPTSDGNGGGSGGRDTEDDNEESRGGGALLFDASDWRRRPQWTLGGDRRMGVAELRSLAHAVFGR